MAGGAYGLYSWIVLRRLAPRYAAMRCLAAIAAPTPNATEIAELAEALPPRAPAPEPADEAWEQLWPAGARTRPLEAKRSGWRDAGDDAVAVRREGAAWKVFARQGDDAARPPGEILAELADPTRPVVEGLFARVPLVARAAAPRRRRAAAAAPGRYSFVFRDYVTSQEALRATARGCGTALLSTETGRRGWMLNQMAAPRRPPGAVPPPELPPPHHPVDRRAGRRRVPLDGHGGAPRLALRARPHLRPPRARRARLRREPRRCRPVGDDNKKASSAVLVSARSCSRRSRVESVIPVCHMLSTITPSSRTAPCVALRCGAKIRAMCRGASGRLRSRTPGIAAQLLPVALQRESAAPPVTLQRRSGVTTLSQA